jgi:hypothetical protein
MRDSSIHDQQWQLLPLPTTYISYSSLRNRLQSATTTCISGYTGITRTAWTAVKSCDILLTRSVQREETHDHDGRRVAYSRGGSKNTQGYGIYRQEETQQRRDRGFQARRCRWMENHQRSLEAIHDQTTAREQKLKAGKSPQLKQSVVQPRSRCLQRLEQWSSSSYLASIIHDALAPHQGTGVSCSAIDVGRWKGIAL